MAVYDQTYFLDIGSIVFWNNIFNFNGKTSCFGDFQFAMNRESAFKNISVRFAEEFAVFVPQLKLVFFGTILTRRNDGNINGQSIISIICCVPYNKGNVVNSRFFRRNIKFQNVEAIPGGVIECMILFKYAIGRIARNKAIKARKRKVAMRRFILC